MSKHRHITRQLLLAARRGQVSWRHLAEVLLDRLSTACPDCRDEAEAAVPAKIPVAAYREPVLQAVRIETDLRRYEEDRKAAPALLSLLRELSPEQRLLRIGNAPERFANLALGEDLLDEARACLPGDAEGSLGWARTAEAVAATYGTPHYPHRILALAYQGNAHRAMGDFDLARTRLNQARNLVQAHQVVDLDLGAELHSLFGSLCRDLSRFDEAAEHLENAAALYKTLGDDDCLARVLIQLGLLHAIVGNFAEALVADKAAIGLLSPKGNPRLYLSARINFARHLAEAGQPETARDYLDYDRDLHEAHADSHMKLRVAWLDARIAFELGDAPGAERGYLEVRKEFVRQRHGFNAALVSLELAALYHGQGRFQELEETAVQAVDLFQAYELHQEALAALVLLRDAARARSLTAETLVRVVEFLREAERVPGARFQSPN